MKKEKKGRVILMAVILLFILGFFVSQYIGNLRQEDRAARLVISRAYSELKSISKQLDVLTYRGESGEDNIEENMLELAVLSNSLVRLDGILSQHAWSFPSGGLGYGGVPNFGCISRTIISHGGHRQNSPPISRGGILSEHDLAYLNTLRYDINHLLALMACPEDQINVNQSLTVHQFNFMLGEFFSKWSFPVE